MKKLEKIYVFKRFSEIKKKTIKKLMELGKESIRNLC